MNKWGLDCVPIIQQDLSHEETLLQIAFALDSLETVASNVFRQVHVNVEKGKTRLEKLQKRCSLIETKVGKITGISKSLKIVSTNKYPVRNDDVFVYSHEPAVVFKPEIEGFCRPLSPDKMNMREKLKFFHVKDMADANLRDFERYPDEGLGDIPNNIKSISGLFLFNTCENLYKKYKLMDPLAQPSKKQTVLEDVYQEKLVEPAPKSLDSHFDWISQRLDKDYFYSPTQTDVPDIEAPIDLPDLPGIAGDLRYSTDKPEVKKSVESEVSLTNSESSASNTEIVPDIVPELHEPVVNREFKESASSNETEISVVVAPPVPPPPPPPAPPSPPPVRGSSAPDSASSTPSGASLPQPTDLRAHLMEAIRKAGGVSTLKPVSKKTEETKPPRKSTGNSMMDELHDKLSWRRKGISGKFDSDTNIMDRIVSMIPPPPSKPPDPESDKEWDD